MEGKITDFYEYFTEECLKMYRETLGPIEMAERLMDAPGLAMHCPEHHFLFPAVLLTAARRAQGAGEERLARDLAQCVARAKNVLGGFCGFYGDCGAGVALGIFVSVLQGTTPKSKQGWALCNRATAEGLLALSAIEGPRCCKRNGYLALTRGLSFAREQLGLDLGPAPEIRCHHFARNKECKQAACPYFPG